MELDGITHWWWRRERALQQDRRADSFVSTPHGGLCTATVVVCADFAGEPLKQVDLTELLLGGEGESGHCNKTEEPIHLCLHRTVACAPPLLWSAQTLPESLYSRWS